MGKIKSDNLILVFVKNILLGKVKTRLAKTKGDVYAFHVYKKLVDYLDSHPELYKINQKYAIKSIKDNVKKNRYNWWLGIYRNRIM